VAWTSRRGATEPFALYAFAAPTTVSTETPLLALEEMGVLYADLAFTLRNHGAVPAAFIIEQSEGGVVNDEEREQVYVAAGKERTFEFRNILRRLWGVTAAGDPDGGFPSVDVSFQVIARTRNATGC
jgi:hypothetical protein